MAVMNKSPPKPSGPSPHMIILHYPLSLIDSLVSPWEIPFTLNSVFTGPYGYARMIKHEASNQTF
jgi:hypothetical protein